MRRRGGNSPPGGDDKCAAGVGTAHSGGVVARRTDVGDGTGFECRAAAPAVVAEVAFAPSFGTGRQIINAPQGWDTPTPAA